jgi:hypothetical protein
VLFVCYCYVLEIRPFTPAPQDEIPSNFSAARARERPKASLSDIEAAVCAPLLLL